jgi:predicted double-glycine peptidase
MALDVPFVAQSHRDGCGAAALEMVLRFHGKGACQSDIFRRLARPDPNLPGRKIIYSTGMKQFAEGVGMTAQLSLINVFDAEKLFREIGFFVFKKKLPLIVGQFLSLTDRRGHYRVVTGVDQRGVYCHDPFDETGAAKFIPFDDYMMLSMLVENGNPGACVSIAATPIAEGNLLPGLGGPPAKPKPLF